MSCEICHRIENLESSPYFVCEMETGYVVIGDTQYIDGYIVFLSKEHVLDMDELPPCTQAKMMEEVFAVGCAAKEVFDAERVHYALLGRDGEDGDTRHVHWHILPRRHGDIPDNAPYWSVSASARNATEHIPSADEVEALAYRMRCALLRRNRLTGM